MLHIIDSANTALVQNVVRTQWRLNLVVDSKPDASDLEIGIPELHLLYALELVNEPFKENDSKCTIVVALARSFYSIMRQRGVAFTFTNHYNSGMFQMDSHMKWAEFQTKNALDVGVNCAELLDDYDHGVRYLSIVGTDIDNLLAVASVFVRYVPCLSFEDLVNRALESPSKSNLYALSIGCCPSFDRNDELCKQTLGLMNADTEESRLAAQVLPQAWRKELSVCSEMTDLELTRCNSMPEIVSSEKKSKMRDFLLNIPMLDQEMEPFQARMVSELRLHVLECIDYNKNTYILPGGYDMRYFVAALSDFIECPKTDTAQYKKCFDLLVIEQVKIASNIYETHHSIKRQKKSSSFTH